MNPDRISHIPDRAPNAPPRPPRPPRPHRTRRARASSASSTPPPPLIPIRPILKRSVTTSTPDHRSPNTSNPESRVRVRVRFANEPIVIEFDPSPEDGPEERARKRDRLKAWGKAFAKKLRFRRKDDDSDRSGLGLRRQQSVGGFKSR